MKRLAAALGVAFVGSLGLVSSSYALNMVVDQNLTTSVNYNSANFATSFDLGATTLSVSSFRDGLTLDQSGLAIGGLVTISNGDIPLALGAPLTLSWTGSQGLFTENLTLTKIISGTGPNGFGSNNGLGLVFGGSLTGGAYTGIVASFVLESEWSNTSGSLAPGGIYIYNAAVGPGTGPVGSAVPEASTWVMMVLGFAGVGLAGYRRNEAAAVAG
jgi:hypothetical protein